MRRRIVLPEMRGDCQALYEAEEHEVVLAGPRDTGKTYVCCAKAHAFCLLNRGAQGTIVRKTQKSLAGTVLKTFARVAKGAGVRAMGGESPSKFIYPNGSAIWLGGMDNSDKVLSSERDFIYANQCEELTLDDWEKLAGSCSGRGAVVAHPQLFGDCNPAGSKHWIRGRAAAGKLRLLNAAHRDNPTIYGPGGELTEEGRARLAVLENLTGVRRKRLFEGIWATAEGAVYDTFDPSAHVRARDPREFKRWFLAMDEGYTNPAVVLLVGEDADGRWHVAKEFYQTHVLQAAVVKLAMEWHLGWKCELAAVDESAAGLIADLLDAGVPALGGKGRVLDGIQRLQDRLKVQDDGKPRLTMDPSCVNVQNEMESYVWKPDRDVPEKENDHSLDALRYLGDALAEPTGAWDGAAAKAAGDAAKRFPNQEELGTDYMPMEQFE